MKEIVPSYGMRLDGNPAAIEQALAWTSEVLGLHYEPTTAADEVPQAELKPDRRQTDGGYRAITAAFGLPFCITAGD